MALDASSIPTYTDAQLLAAVRSAKVSILLGGQSYEIGGRRFTRADLAELNKMEGDLTLMIEGDGPDVAVARFGRPV